MSASIWNPGEEIFIDFGADYLLRGIGDGSDETALITAALSNANGRWIYANPTKVYGVSGDILLPTECRIRNLKLKQLSPNSTTRKTLYAVGSSLVQLENVSVDINGDGSNGSMGTSAGIWLQSVSKVVLNNVEVTGNGYTNGIVTHSCSDVRIDKPYIHDMTHGTASSVNPGDDRINGIWTILCNRVVIVAPIIKNLLGRWSGQPAFNRYTRGIVDGGSHDYTLVAPTIENVDQGYDNTGDNGAARFSVLGGSASNCYSFGFKAANTPTHGSFVGVTAYRCGISGFIASPPGAAAAPQTRYIEYSSCHAIDTGYGGAWVGLATITGFRAASTGAYTDFPRNVRWIGCTSRDTTGIQQYGFFSDVVGPGGAGDQWVEAVECTVVGANIRDYQGVNQGILRAELINPTPLFSGTNVPIPLDTIDVNRAQFGVNGGTGVITCLRSGIYAVSISAEFETDPTGIRQIDVYRNASFFRRVRVPTLATSNVFINVAIAALEVDKNDTFQFYAMQNSGGLLNLHAVQVEVLLVRPGRGRT